MTLSTLVFPLLQGEGELINLFNIYLVLTTLQAMSTELGI